MQTEDAHTALPFSDPAPGALPIMPSYRAVNAGFRPPAIGLAALSSEKLSSNFGTWAESSVWFFSTLSFACCSFQSSIEPFVRMSDGTSAKT